MQNRKIKLLSILAAVLIMALAYATACPGIRTAAAKLPQTGNTVPVPKKYQNQASERAQPGLRLLSDGL